MGASQQMKEHLRPEWTQRVALPCTACTVLLGPVHKQTNETALRACYSPECSCALCRTRCLLGNICQLDLQSRCCLPNGCAFLEVTYQCNAAAIFGTQLCRCCSAPRAAVCLISTTASQQRKASLLLAYVQRATVHCSAFAVKLPKESMHQPLLIPRMQLYNVLHAQYS